MLDIKSNQDLNFHSFFANQVYAVDIAIPNADINFEDSVIDSLFEAQRNTCKVLNIGHVKKKLFLTDIFCDKITIGTLPQTIILNDIAVKSYINLVGAGENLTTVQTNKRTKLYLRGVDFSKLRLNYTDFQLSFDGYIPKLKDSEITLVYEGLLNNFKERGQLQSYELLDIEYQSFLDTSPFKIESFVNKLWWNFGYFIKRM
ncbi:hypothetical protein ACFQ3S_14355 [Mucilaginibacter terrae]|uniref:hypothetical protein n=1 Tax=Mucilaginibacter terrae TaxID=1955052 RepID=UPI00362AA02C